MKKLFLLKIAILGLILPAIGQATYIISINGFSFSPSELNIQIGDTVQFNGSSSHPILEVSEATWNSNDNTALPGGFTFANGVGKIKLNNVGIHYFVCGNHYSSGMKGKIIVSTPTNINVLADVEFKLFPNPLNQDLLNLNINSEANSLIQVKIYDLIGKIRIDKMVKGDNGAFQIDCSSMFSGVYIIQAFVGNKVLTSKLVIDK